MKNLKQYLLINIVFIMYSLIGVIGKINAMNSIPFSIKFFAIFTIQVFLMVIYTVIWQISIKNIDLTNAFAFKGATIIWGMVFAKVIFNEMITLTNIIGAFIIALGILVVVKSE